MSTDPAIDVLPLLPPDAVIEGFVGDKRSYVRFTTTAGTARADIAVVCADHAANWKGLHESIPNHVRESTSPASTWFASNEGETKVTLEEFPCVTLYLDTPSRPGGTDIRTDPWVLRRVEFGYVEFSSWDDPPDTAAKTAEMLTKLAALFTRLSGQV